MIWDDPCDSTWLYQHDESRNAATDAKLGNWLSHAVIKELFQSLHCCVSYDNCGRCFLSPGAFWSLRPAQLAAPLRCSVLCKYKQLLYQHEQPPWAMLNEYLICCAYNKLPIVVLGFLLLWQSHSNKIICLRSRQCRSLFPHARTRQRVCLIGNMKQLVF